MTRKIIFSLFCFISLFAFSQTEVTRGITKGKEYGVAYFLPKTKIVLEVTLEKNIYELGELSKYAHKYLMMNPTNEKNEVEWNIISAKLSVQGVPDKNASYFIKMKDKTTAPHIQLTKDGIIKSINVGVGIEAYMPVASNEDKEQKKRIDGRKFLSEEILKAGSIAKMAELVAKEIYSIRESKNDLIKGQAENMPQDGKQLQIMIENLEIQEKALTELFIGHTSKEKKTFFVSIIPDDEVKNMVLFRFSKRLGLVDKDDLSGEPYYINVSRSNNGVEFIDPSLEKKKKLEGIAYNVPEQAYVTIDNGKDRLIETSVPLAQFGIIEFLAPALFNKSTITKVFFDTATGGLISVDREEKR